MAQANPVAVWDFTLAVGDWTEATVKAELTPERVKKWAFQLERGDETGYIHFQGRVSLSNKRRTHPTWLPGAHWSVTSSNARLEEFYVLKEDTRLAGPWTDRDDPPPFIDDDVREAMAALRPWQETVLASMAPDAPRQFRQVNIIVDVTGNIGKTTVSDVARFRGHGTTLHAMDNAKDMMRQVMNKPKKGGYIIDLPRALPKKDLAQLYAAIESIKDGHAFDDRYKFTEEYFKKPVVWVFTNVRPDTALLSPDRWVFWEVEVDGTLSEVVPAD